MTPCILHQSAPTAFGYGRVGQEHAHRVAYRKAYGEFDKRLWILHKCDVRMCVNPEHLFLGNADLNNKDRMRKGRNGDLSGENNGRCKITDGQTAAVKIDVRSHRAIAKDYGLGKTQVGRIKRGESR